MRIATLLIIRMKNKLWVGIITPTLALDKLIEKAKPSVGSDGREVAQDLLSWPCLRCPQPSSYPPCRSRAYHGDLGPLRTQHRHGDSEVWIKRETMKTPQNSQESRTDALNQGTMSSSYQTASIFPGCPLSGEVQLPTRQLPSGCISQAGSPRLSKA